MGRARINRTVLERHDGVWELEYGGKIRGSLSGLFGGKFGFKEKSCFTFGIGKY